MIPDVMQKRGIDIVCCREVHFEAQGQIFAVVGDILVKTYSNPPRIEPWTKAKKRIMNQSA